MNFSGMVDHQARYSEDRIVIELGPFCKALGFDLVFNWDKGKVDSVAMDCSFDKSECATDAVQLDQFWRKILEISQGLPECGLSIPIACKNRCRRV